MNSDLKQRLRGVNGLTCHKTVSKNDVQSIVKIIQYLDALYGVWEDGVLDKEVNKWWGMGVSSGVEVMVLWWGGVGWWYVLVLGLQALMVYIFISV